MLFRVEECTETTQFQVANVKTNWCVLAQCGGNIHADVLHFGQKPHTQREKEERQFLRTNINPFLLFPFAFNPNNEFRELYLFFHWNENHKMKLTKENKEKNELIKIWMSWRVKWNSCVLRCVRPIMARWYGFWVVVRWNEVVAFCRWMPWEIESHNFWSENQAAT